MVEAEVTEYGCIIFVFDLHVYPLGISRFLAVLFALLSMVTGINLTVMPDRSYRTSLPTLVIPDIRY